MCGLRRDKVHSLVQTASRGIGVDHIQSNRMESLLGGVRQQAIQQLGADTAAARGRGYRDAIHQKLVGGEAALEQRQHERGTGRTEQPKQPSKPLSGDARGQCAPCGLEASDTQNLIPCHRGERMRRIERLLKQDQPRRRIGYGDAQLCAKSGVVERRNLGSLRLRESASDRDGVVRPARSSRHLNPPPLAPPACRSSRPAAAP